MSDVGVLALERHDSSGNRAVTYAEDLGQPATAKRPKDLIPIQKHVHLINHPSRKYRPVKLTDYGWPIN